MHWMTDPQTWIALLTLTALEIVLGVDNIIFISILSAKVPQAQRDKARRVGLALAMLMRIALLLCLTWVMKLTSPLFAVLGHAVSGRDLILLIGGTFLIGKSTFEIHEKLEGTEGGGSARAAATFRGVVTQIMLLDIVFSLDSVITAVGMAQQVAVMVAAVVISVLLMMWWSRAIGEFVEGHPTIKMLALSFLILIGVNLVAEGLGHHIPKGYTYFAMAFSVMVEMINLKLRARLEAPIRLREAYPEK
ncbi:MAG: TerC family protein [Elusimicrobiales bacterium]|nr:TerC family protein [Elusimicrobiales bacterium]